MELGVLWHAGLDEEGRFLRVDAGAQPVYCYLLDVGAYLVGVLVAGRKRVRWDITYGYGLLVKAEAFRWVPYYAFSKSTLERALRADKCGQRCTETSAQVACICDPDRGVCV